MKESTILAWILGSMTILGSFAATASWIYEYHDKFETKIASSIRGIDIQMSITENLVTNYELHGLDLLTLEQAAKYRRGNARLISLQAKRDAITNGTRN